MKIQFLLPFFCSLLFSISCSNFIGGELNSDPNNPIDVPLFAMTPAIQINIADVYGGQFSRFNNLLVQHAEGVQRQWISVYQYTGMTPARFDTVWQNVYENILVEIKIAKEKAVAQNNNHYLGILNTMEAFILMAATDVWDDMPYTEALNGFNEFNPSYDTQAEIYTSVFQLLNDAENLFESSAGPVVPGDEDVFYNGNISLWKKAVQAIRARGLLHQKDYRGALDAAKASFDSPSDNMGYHYPDASSAGPWYRFNDGRTGDIEFHPVLRTIMESYNDSLRLSAWDQIFTTSHTYFVPDFFQELVTYRELQFIISECDFRLNNGSTDEGYDAYTNGIAASFARSGFEGQEDSYIEQNNVGLGAENLDLESIMTQKHIAMFMQPEAYSDFRRTGIPTLVASSGVSIPVRWHYSSEEYLFNINSPSETEVNIFTDKVGWNR